MGQRLSRHIRHLSDIIVSLAEEECHIWLTRAIYFTHLRQRKKEFRPNGQFSRCSAHVSVCSLSYRRPPLLLKRQNNNVGNRLVHTFQNSTNNDNFTLHISFI